MTAYTKLDKTPIKEIILTVSFNENISMEILKKFCEVPKIANKFSNVSSGFLANVKKEKDKKPQATVSNNGYILQSSEDRIIQARNGSFAYHKVKGYEPFDILLKEFEELWSHFLSCTVDQISISNLSLRYLNFVQINADEDINDLLNIKTQQPFTDKLGQFLTHLKFNYDKMPEINIDLIAARGTNEGENGIILDIILNTKLTELRNYEVMFSTYNKMRDVKNDIFFKSITESTVKKYQNG